ncbi:MAG TPA: GrpB family protein [Clostridia bacterium]|nr:GrpB family protein [Clostridia bacterium]
MAREIAVIPHDPVWKALYEQEEALLRRIFDGLLIDIQHFGSTSIPGMPSKPIIDILITVPDIQAVDACDGLMIQNRYLPKGENGIAGRRYFVKFKDDGENHSHHVHIYEPGNPHVADELLFRDFVSMDQAAFEAYAKVKLEAAQAHRFSPPAYTDAKTECVRRIMERARKQRDALASRPT